MVILCVSPANLRVGDRILRSRSSSCDEWQRYESRGQVIKVVAMDARYASVQDCDPACDNDGYASRWRWSGSIDTNDTERQLEVERAEITEDERVVPSPLPAPPDPQLIVVRAANLLPGDQLLRYFKNGTWHEFNFIAPNERIVRDVRDNYVLNTRDMRLIGVNEIVALRRDGLIELECEGSDCEPGDQVIAYLDDGWQSFGPYRITHIDFNGRPVGCFVDTENTAREYVVAASSKLLRVLRFVDPVQKALDSLVRLTKVAVLAWANDMVAQRNRQADAIDKLVLMTKIAVLAWADSLDDFQRAVGHLELRDRPVKAAHRVKAAPTVTLGKVPLPCPEPEPELFDLLELD